MSQQPERRTRRYDVRLDIEVRQGDKRLTGVTRNLSLGGVFVEGQLSLAFNSRVDLRFFIPNQKEPVEVGGVVRWNDSGGIGVQFDGLRARDVWALGKFFEQQ